MDQQRLLQLPMRLFCFRLGGLPVVVDVVVVGNVVVIGGVGWRFPALWSRGRSVVHGVGVGSMELSDSCLESCSSLQQLALSVIAFVQLFAVFFLEVEYHS